MANVTLDTCFQENAEKIKSLLYTFSGLGAAMTNTILILAAMTHPAVRAKAVFKIICFVALMDLIEGGSTFCAGIYRLLVIALGFTSVQFTPRQCMLYLPWSYFWRVSDFGTAFMLLALSIDRYYAVYKPIRYVTLGKAYAWVLIGVPYMLSLLFGTATAFYPMDENNSTSMLCMTSYFSPKSYQISKYSSSIVSGCSVLLYLPITWKLWHHSVELKTMGMVMQNQYQMSWTVGISCLCTLLFDTVPRAIGVWGTIAALEAAPTQCESWMSHFFHLTKINSMINCYLYWRRSDQMQEAIQDLWEDIKCCKLCCYIHKPKKTSHASRVAVMEMQRLRFASVRLFACFLIH